MEKFDAIIIGSGQAGTPLAFKLAKEGKSVAIIEKEKWGGTCVNTGCTPTKTYVASARRIWAAKNSSDLGVQIDGSIKADLAQIKARKDELINASHDGILSGLKDTENITVFEGEAQFTGNKEISLSREKLQAEQIFINVGGRPRVPNEYQAAGPLTNASILELEKIPEHLIIAGGSYIGLEFGQMFRRFGSKVTIIEKNSRLLHHEDKDVSQNILEIMEKEGIEFRFSATCMGAKKTSAGRVLVNVECETGQPQAEGSHLLLAIGRLSNADKLNLGVTDVKIDEHNFIEVDDKLHTSVEGVYALGDCNGQGAFTHTSYNDYEIITNHLYGDNSRTVANRFITYGLFIDPPLGRVGMTLAQAKKSGKNILVAERPMSKVSRAKEKGETDGFMRVIVDADSEKILGAHILGVGGDEIIAGITNLMYAGASYKVLRDSVQIHPTVSELLPTMLESLEKPE